MNKLEVVYRLPPTEPLFEMYNKQLNFNYSRKRHRYRNPNLGNRWNESEDVKTLTFGLGSKLFDYKSWYYDNIKVKSLSLLFLHFGWSYWYTWKDEDEIVN